MGARLMTPRRLDACCRLAVAVVLTTAVGGAAGLAVTGFSAPFAPNPLAGLGVSAEERAVRSAEAASPDAALWNARFIAAVPASARGWTLQAYLEGRDGFTPASAEALRRSYVVAPLGPTDSVWRLTYLYENWDRLPTNLRRSARVEHRTHERQHGSLSPEIISNPAGRLAAGLTKDAGYRERLSDWKRQEVERARAGGD